MRLRLPGTWSIRNRLLLYCVFIVAFTAIAISIVTALLVSRDAHDRVVGQLESVATLKQQEVDSWVGGLRLNLDIVLSAAGISADLHTLTQVAPTSAAYQAAHARVLRRFTWAANRMGLFEELFFMGRKGEVLASTERGHEQQQLGVNDYYTEGMRNKFIQEPSYSLSLHKMTVVASSPVTYQDATIGVLAGRANLKSLNALMVGRAGLGQTGETYLVGSNHRLLTDLRRPGYALPDTYIRSWGSTQAVDRTRSGFATYQSYAGVTVIGVYKWTPGLKVGLLAEQGEAEALHATQLALWTAGGVALVAALLAILVGIVLIHSIVRPLSELGGTASQIADGDLDLVAPVRRNDEIGKLAHAFNRMTHRLRDLAAAKERQRLARDLHDAVSQTLFSVSLMAEVLPRIYERDPEQGRQRLEELRQLTRGALAEMRMLLLELRPAALAETSLADLLRQLSEAVVGRARIPVELDVDSTRELPPDVAVAMYRIAQEALNNVVKHAGAEQVLVSLRDGHDDGGDLLELVITDDGCGFDVAAGSSGRLGLGIMAERAQSIGAQLKLSSSDDGTCVRAIWRP